ncbi:MAG TPA: 3-methyl-2-oxobutanoate dehydrogenase subunit VorB [Candidatus Omnitrophota bacterium]|nr:3-methyl-2-oxobutanoate dehydrogenase subunit VorB [Candidatus Omnitrophota bacterium]HPS19787.1 3-methyl-2-oxobutanoate dehydrogenase subunit VorB [Candidatus Omnitrophota bacterium]
MKKKYLCTGNEACGEGAMRAGCRFYAGYPITPQNELTAYMSVRMDEVGGTFIQAESEVSAINMVFGASVAGARAMTSSSSPGISLKQEGISYIAACELPVVIVNVMRGGPGLGNIMASQADYFQATKGGGHGDYHLIVLAPASVQEMFDFTYEAFALADKYRNPVMILADGTLGQMMEPLEFEENIPFSKGVSKPWALTGAKGRSAQHVKSLILGGKDETLEEHNLHLQEKYRKIIENEVRIETENVGGAEIILVAYGAMSRIGYSCVEAMREKGKKVGMMIPKTLWPFPYDEIRGIAEKNKHVKFLVVEMSSGQMVEDVRLAVQDDKRVFFYGRMGGGIPTEDAIAREILKIAK